MRKRLLALVLVLAMIISVTPVMALAASSEGDVINYVSLGDSMTNGYGLEGYEKYDEVTGDFTNHYGFLIPTYDSYPAKVARTFDWDLTQLATSGVRADDVYYLLNLGTPYEVEWDEYGIAYIDGKFRDAFKADPQNSGIADTDENVIAYAAEIYQESVKNADVISVGIGSNNFATLMNMRVSWWMGKIIGSNDILDGYDGEFDLNQLVGDLTEEEKAQISELYAVVESRLLETVSENGVSLDEVIVDDKVETPEDETETLADFIKDMSNSITYTTAGFMVGYKGIIDTIIRENDDAEIIIVGLSNWFRGMNYALPIDGEEFIFPLGDLMEYVCELAGVYMAALPAAYAIEAEANGVALQPIYFADTNAEGVADVELIIDIITRNANVNFDAIYAVEDDETTPENECVEAALPYATSITSAMIPDGTTRARLLDVIGNMVLGSMGMLKPNMKQVEAFEAFLASGEPMSDSSEAFISFLATFAYNTDLIEDYVGCCVAYLGIEKAMIASTCIDVLDMEHLDVLSSMENLMDATMKAVGPYMSAPDPNYIGAALMADPQLTTVCNLLFSFTVGSGVILHPSEAGHQTIADVVVDAYDNKHTAEDETEENLDKAVEIALGLIYEYRYEIYEYAYNYAETEGYIDTAIEQLEALRGYINAVDYSSTGASAELKAKLDAVVAALNGDIDALIKFIEDAKTLQQFEADILDLIGEFTNDMTEFEALLKQAGIDGQTQLNIAYEAIQGYISDTMAAVYDYIYGIIEDAYEAIVDEIAALAAAYGPEVEAFVREWLIENPQAVISTLIEFGEDVEAFIRYWTPYVKLIAGPAWNAYGGDLMAALAEVAGMLQAEGTELAEEALKALADYVDGLKLEEQILEIAENTKNSAVTLAEETLGELSAIVDELNAQLEAEVDAIVAALQTLAASEDAADAKTLIQETIDSVLAQEADVKAQLAVIEANIINAKGEVETAVAAIDSLYDIIKPILIVLINPNVLDTDTDEAVNALVAELAKAAGKVQDAVETLITLTDDITVAGEKIDASIKAMYGDLCTAAGKVENTVVEAGYDTVALMADTYAAIETLVTKTANKVTTDATALAQFCGEKLAAAVAEFNAAVESVLYKATHGDLLVDAKTRYVAIGDEEDVYTTELAALLGLEDYQIANKLTAATDLVTVDFGATDFSEFISAQAAGYVAELIKGDKTLAGLMSGSYADAIKGALDSYGIDLTAEVAELDWDKYLDAKAIGVKDETIKGIRITAVDHGLMETYTLDLGAILQPVLDAETGVPGLVTIDCVIEIPVADLACALLDNVLYSYVSFAADYAVSLNEIREVAPDAEVVVLGLVDADEDLVFSVGEAAIDLGDYTDILVNFVNAHYFAYALINGEDVTYVAENTAEAIYNALNITSTDWWTCDGTNCACNVFTDLKHDAWYHDAICYNYNFGLMIGMSADKFEPSTTTSRAMIVTTLYRLEGEPAVTGENSYKDVKDGVWYTDAIIWATENGIVEGYGNGLFGPAHDVTREQIATMLYRYADYLGMDVSDSSELEGYTDVGDIHGWALDAMKWANAVKLMEGRTENTLNPRDNTMRSELATLLYRWDHGFAE